MGTVKKKVILGFSGGVDSAVAGHLLRKKGFQVKAIFLKLWKNSSQGERQQEKEIKQAQKIAQELKMEFQIVDVQKEFYKTVVSYYLKELAKSNTPNPCFICNPNLKINLLEKIADQENINFIATGHYARIKKNKSNQTQLWKGKDLIKDQSYFLAGLKQIQLQKLIFPLGKLSKNEVKKIAQEIGLNNFISQQESQELCFIFPGTEKEFLEKNLKIQKGNIINFSGEKIGEHQGLPFYTLGQRKGMGLGGDGPYYVVAKNQKNNQLKVSRKMEIENFSIKKVKVKQINWINDQPKINQEVLVKTRYQQKEKLVYIEKINKDTCQFRFKTEQLFITPGQAAVFYSLQGKVLGGGIIK